MSDRPLCSHGGHDDGSKWCDEAREALCNRLQLVRIRLGTDFETHGGKKVMYVGVVGWSWPMVPYGAIGTVESSSDTSVMVIWDCTSTNGIPKPYYAHSWKELEVLKTDDDGKILPGEIERASLKIAPRILELALPCPVCGSKTLSFGFGDNGCNYVFCSGDYGKCGGPPPEPHCGARGPVISDQFPELMAIAVWNIRGVPEALTKEIRGFPKGDVEVLPVVDVINVKNSPCPWCLGTKVSISWQEDIDSWHGHCEHCGGHGPWWPLDYKNRAKSAADVVRDWKRRLVKVPS